jgi:hypothetical protein
MNKRKQAAITITQTGYYDRLGDKRFILLKEGDTYNVKRFATDSEKRDSYVIEVWRDGGEYRGGGMVSVIVEMENCK